MQLGARWTAGDSPHPSVPPELHAQIAAVEAAAPLDGGPRPRWTLTFLEGRPIAELDTGVIVTVTAEGDVVVRHDADDIFP